MGKGLRSSDIVINDIGPLPTFAYLKFKSTLLRAKACIKENSEPKTGMYRVLEHFNTLPKMQRRSGVQTFF